MEGFINICPICKSKKTLKLYNSKIDRRNQYTRFLLDRVVKNKNNIKCSMKFCLNCFLCFFNYRYSIEELDNLYSACYTKKRSQYIEGYKPSYDSNKAILESRSNLIRKLLVLQNYSKYRKWRKSGKVLDFGGWHGRNIPDIADKTKKYVLDKSNHKVDPHIIKLNQLKSIKFDLIMSTHVFEHLVDPLKVLKELGNSLKKDGLIYLELPADIIGLIRKPPIYEHINFFSRYSIKNLAYMSNLEILSLKIEKYPYAYHNTIAYLAVLQKNKRQKKLKNNLSIRIFDIFKDLINYAKVKFNRKYTLNI